MTEDTRIISDEIRTAVSDIRSAINAKHSLVGIAILLMFQQACIVTDMGKKTDAITTQCVERINSKTTGREGE